MASFPHNFGKSIKNIADIQSEEQNVSAQKQASYAAAVKNTAKSNATMGIRIRGIRELSEHSGNHET